MWRKKFLQYPGVFERIKSGNNTFHARCHYMAWLETKHVKVLCEGEQKITHVAR